MLNGLRKSKTSSPERLRHIEQELRRLSDASVSSSSSPGENSLGARTFRDWVRAAQDLRDPDRIRNALYYGFQPLYDVLVDDALSDGNRPGALRILDELTATSVSFLTGFYKGQPDVAAYRERMRTLAPEVEKLSEERYRTKFRNVDYNGIYPDQINLFLRQFLESTLDGKIFAPDYVIGCACGSSEMVMPLAGALGVDVDFIRRSWRRGDDTPVVIMEQDGRIAGRARERETSSV